MWTSYANFKEKVSKIALEVHDDGDEEEEELGIYGSRNGGLHDSYSNSHTFAHSQFQSLSNGIDSAFNPEIEGYKAEIKRLQESEAEIKALSVNYAALLKEREGSPDQSPKRQHKFTTQVKNRYSGNQTHNGQDGISNGITHAGNQTLGHKLLADTVEESNRSTAGVQVNTEIKQLRMELEKERDKLAYIQSKLHEEHKLNESFQEELKSLKLDRDKTSMEMSVLRNELGEKISEIQRLQMELNRREDEGTDDVLESLKRVIASLEKENSSLKMEDSSGSFPGKEEMELSLQKLDKDLKETRRERDKALQELGRLKQHLLEKEFEESEKMDEDSKIIEQLRENNEYQRAQILRLEKALKQAIASQEEIKMSNNNEILKSKDIIDDLNKKLANCIAIIDAKNVELLNLQTALGQYYAEIEAKEHLEGDLARARDEVAKLSKLLKDADQRAEVSKEEKEEILAKLSQSEKMLEEWKSRVNKLEEDNAKVRRALEQSMTRLNRMSMDSDYLVDRRIVIKLLVTYFQRNHSKEVLDLMVRMLGFSEEDKQRIGVAQHGAGKGVVRGVLGLPGRLVGGILGGGSAESAATTASENQSFADLWVDFLLTENERERRDLADVAGRSKENSHGRGSNAAVADAFMANHATNSAGTASSSFSRLNFSPNQNSSPFPSRGDFRHSEHFDSEFSTVPLTSSDNTPQISRLLPKY